jgi:hypothetical protein
MVLPELKRRVPSASTKMPLGEPSPGMLTVVTVASRAAWRARLAAERAAISLDVKLRWGFETAVELARALKFLREKFAETEANKQTFGEVDSCCAGSTSAPWTA